MDINMIYTSASIMSKCKVSSGRSSWQHSISSILNKKEKKNNYVSIIHLTMNILQYCNAKQQGSSISLFEIRSICIVPGLVLVWGVESVKAIINSVWIYLDSQNSHERQLHISMSFPWKY